MKRFVGGVGKQCLTTGWSRARRAAPFRSIADVVQRSALERSSARGTGPRRRLRAVGTGPAPKPRGKRCGPPERPTMPLAPAHGRRCSPPGRCHRSITALSLLDYFATGFCIDGHPDGGLRDKLRPPRRRASSRSRFTQRRDKESGGDRRGCVIARQRTSDRQGRRVPAAFRRPEFGHMNGDRAGERCRRGSRSGAACAIVMLIQGIAGGVARAKGTCCR